MKPHTLCDHLGEVWTSKEIAEPVVFASSHSLQVVLFLPNGSCWNQFVFLFSCASASELLPNDDVERLNDVKFLVQQLYTTLRIEDHQLSKERELIGRLEDLNSQLRPLEKVLMLIQTFLLAGI